MAIYRGPGGAGDATGDATNASALALAAKDEAQASATAAANSATAAAASATSAANDAASASSSATSAAISRTAAAASATQAESVLSTAVKLTGDQTVAGVKTFSSTIAGSINGNAATVTNGVYTTGDQTIAGTKTFSSTIAGSINGNAATVTNGVYTTGDQTIAGTKTFLSTISGSINGSASTATSATTATTATNVSGGTASVTTLTTSSTVTHNGGTANRLTYLNGSKVLSTSDILVFDGANLGLNVTPPTSVSSSGGIYLANTANIAATGPYLHFGANYYYVLTTPKYTSTAPAAIYSSYNGTHLWRVAPSGTADATITWTTALTLDANADMYLPKNFYIGDASNTSSQISSGSSSNPLIFGINGTEKARIDTSGNFGLGVTPSSWGSTYAKPIQLGNKGAAVSGFTSSYSVTPYANVSVNAYFASDATWKYFDGGYGASLYQQQANEHRWSIAGTGTTGSSITFTQAMTLNASGYLGVGTSSPGVKFDTVGVMRSTFDSQSNGGATTHGLVARQSTTSTKALVGGYSTSGNQIGAYLQAVNFGTAYEDLTLQPQGGNLGLGVTPSAWGSIFRAFQIGNSDPAFIAARTDGPSQIHAGVNAFYDGTNWKYINADYASRYYQSGGTHVWETAASGSAGSTVTFTQAMTLDASGRLLIGTTTASSMLTVAGTITSKAGGQGLSLSPSTTTNAAYMTATNGAGTSYIGIDDSAGNAFGAAYATFLIGGGARPLLLGTNGTERARIDSSGNLGIGLTPTSGYGALQVLATGSIISAGVQRAVEIYDAGSGSGEGGAITFSSATCPAFAAVYGVSANPGGSLIFATNSANAGYPTERARIDSSGNFLVGTTGSGGEGGITLAPNADDGAGRITFDRATTTASSIAIVFENGNTTSGQISYTNTATTYATSSDYRLKENIAPMTGALATVVQLKPCTYTWKQDGSEGQGFIAHELQEIVPQAVTGEKDAVDADGNPEYQGIDTSFLVATLTAAIQEQQAIIESLKARLDAANL